MGQDYRCDKKQDAMEKQESKTSNGTNNERLKIKKRKKRGGRGEERQRTVVIGGCEKTTNSI